MRVIVNWLFLTTLSIWVGTIAFVTFILAPTLKAQFSADQFSQIVNTLLPTYFQLGIVVGTIAFLIAIVRTLRTDYPKRLLKWVNTLLFVMLVLNVVGRYVLLPQMQEAGASAEQFIELYNYTQGVSLLNLLFGLFALLFISIDMRLLPGKPYQGGYSIRY